MDKPTGQQNFFTEVIKADPRYNTVKRVSDIALLEPVFRQAVEAILQEAKTEGLELMVFETYRSQVRQSHLYDQGVTQLKVVGVHHYGLGADIVKVINGQPSWDGDFAFLGKLARKHNLISGLDWGEPDKHHSFVDPCHIQRIRVKDQNKLFSGVWYPDEKYDPYQNTG